MPKELKVRPLQDNVLVRCHDAVDRSKGGIYIADVSKENLKPRRGEVLRLPDPEYDAACGTAAEGKRTPKYIFPFKVGDVILFAQYAGQQVPDDGLKETGLKLIPLKDIIGVIEN